MKTASGSDFLFDNTLGTQVKRTQATLNLEFKLAEHYTLSDRLRYDDTGTVRNGVFPNQLQSAASFLMRRMDCCPLSSRDGTATALHELTGYRVRRAQPKR